MQLAYYLTIFVQKLCCIGVFVSFYTNFMLFFTSISEKIVKFFAIFSLCVSMIYEKVTKIIAQNT